MQRNSIKHLKIDDLPLEMLTRIFESYLDLRDLFRMSLVNKKFNLVIKQCRVRELVFENNYKYRYNWFGLNISMDLGCVVDKSKLSILKKTLFNITLLKRLKIDNLRDNYKINLQDICELRRLEVLEISLDQCTRKENKKLSMPNLQILSFTSNNKYTNIEFELPSLHTLELNCNSLVSIKFIYPLSVRRLETYEYKPELLMFTNLEYMKFFTHIRTTHVKQLFMFNNLHEIHVDDYKFECVRLIIWERTRLKRIHPIVFHQGYQMDTVNDVEDFKNKFCYLSHNWLMKNHLEHYSRLADNLDWVIEIDYSYLTNFITSLPSDFFDKYNSIQKVYVNSQVRDSAHLLNFISNCRNLSKLMLQNADLDQSFFEQLPQISNLNELTINETYPTRLNFEFVRKMFYLKDFRTNLEASIDLIQAFNSTSIKFVQFTFNKTSIRIEKFRGNKYHLKSIIENQIQIGFFNEMMSLDELIKSLDYLISKETITTRSKFKRLKTN